MRRVLIGFVPLLLLCSSPAAADESEPVPDGEAETVPGAVRVTILVSGGEQVVQSVSGGSSGSGSGCQWSVLYAPDLDDTPYGTSAGPRPRPDARFALLLCNGQVMQPIWVSPSDVIDLDAVARDEAQRYIEDVLVPNVRIGVNPAARGLVGLGSWFWIEGFAGSVTAPPISAYGLTIDVRMSSGSVAWAFGDGATLVGDLGRAYPVESTVQHTHQTDGAFTVTATIDLVPEYRVDGGPWLTLPNLQATATVQHQVEERQAVITKT
jgi:hypothetical protein